VAGEEGNDEEDDEEDDDEEESESESDPDGASCSGTFLQLAFEVLTLAILVTD
jgi:hypothetical protein